MHNQNIKLRLPLDGHFDLTYRCNNNCRHCWLWLPSESKEKNQELSTDEIYQIVKEARRYGTQAWYISGGEPMLRSDFYEIFDYITRKSVFYNLNTNGTLITPKIAQLMKRKGKKMIALYGADAEVHDHITRTPGSFEATMRGFNYLKEAGASFFVQIIPMRDNYHQYKEMLLLAQSLSSDYRIGATWLNLSANHSTCKNKEIIAQRLDPHEVVSLEPPIPSLAVLNEYLREHTNQFGNLDNSKDIEHSLFQNCINDKQEFHIDPYGGMSFCPFIKDNELRFNLREFSFSQVWDGLIPSIKDKILANQEYRDNCGSCDLRQDCNWCPVYSFLEHGRYSAKIDYLCEIAQLKKGQMDNWKNTHRRFYQIAGLTIMVCSDFQITDETFSPAIRQFQVDQPGDDTITIRLVPSIPPVSDLKLGREFFRQQPWAIYRNRDAWIYLGIKDEYVTDNLFNISIFNDDHSNATIFSDILTTNDKNLTSLTMHPTDQILLTRVLADRQACFFHSAGIIINGQGFLFVGHSEAGKSTIMKMLRAEGEMLGDDRIIVRHWFDGFKIHGTWSHGELQQVSPNQAPLSAIFFLEQAKTNELIPFANKRDLLGRLLSHVIKGLITEDWWDKTLKLADKLAAEVPAYRLRFDKSGQVVDVLAQLYQ